MVQNVGKFLQDRNGSRSGLNSSAVTCPRPRGAVTTSGDLRRYLLKDGVRYGHILDPRTGWPVQDAPRSVTVLEVNCTQAGLLSTLAILHGAGAERFLAELNVKHWVVR